MTTNERIDILQEKYQEDLKRLYEQYKDALEDLNNVTKEDIDKYGANTAVHYANKVIEAVTAYEKKRELLKVVTWVKEG